MVTLKTDNRHRISLPGIKAGQVFAFEHRANGVITLTPVKPIEPLPGKVRFIKKNGYTVGHTDKQVSPETIKELLSEFP